MCLFGVRVISKVSGSGNCAGSRFAEASNRKTVSPFLIFVPAISVSLVKKPVVKNDQIVVGQTMTLTLSCDHRVVDGAVGAQYLNALKTLLESPALLLI